MKKLLFTLAVLLPLVGFSQIDTLYATTITPVSIWDSPNLATSKFVKSISCKESIAVDISTTYGDKINYYKLADGTGYVRTIYVSHQLPNCNYKTYTVPKIKNSVDPCKKADHFKTQYEKSGKPTDLDQYRKWFSKCMDKEY